MTDFAPRTALGAPGRIRACFACVVLAGLLTACDGPSAPAPGGPSPGQAPTPAPASGPPRLTFETNVHDFGRIPQTSKTTTHVRFTNTGTGPLVIEQIKTTCGCTAATIDRTSYGPGETGRIAIEFDPSAPGDQKKYVNVISNDPEGVSRLEIVATVEPFLAIEPNLLQLRGIVLGQEHVATVRVSSPVSDMEILDVRATNPLVRGEVQKKDDRGWAVRITVSPDAPWGGFFSWLQVTGRGRPDAGSAPITHTSRIRIQGQVFGRVQASPHTIRFGVEPGEAFERRVTLTRTDGQPLTVSVEHVEADCLEAVRADVLPAGPTSAILRLQATGGVLGQCGGTVHLRTNVPGEERLPLPLVGVMRR